MATGTSNPPGASREPTKRAGPLGLNSYQWTVLLAAWLGWGFDVFDGLLFNYVAPNCIPTLLHLTIGSKEAKTATLLWGGILTSLLLIGWAAGGLIFGRICDRIGRTRTLLATIVLYAVGTGCCALAPNIWALIAFRFVAALGIGGEWAAGASLVAEVVPEERRVEAGGLLYTSAPAGLFLASGVNYWIAGNLLVAQPEVSWRYVFLAGVAPALLAFAARMFVKEPERWQRSTEAAAQSKLSELFSAAIRPATISGLVVAIVALIMWWSTNAFIPTTATLLAGAAAQAHGLAKAAQQQVENWKFIATSCFNWGGLIGTLLTIPLAKKLGRKPMFAIYFLLSAAALFTTFGPAWDPKLRLYLYFLNGLTVFGVFGSFTYYLPELFPTRLRATGAGFCYNIGRVVTAIGPFLIAFVATRPGGDALALALKSQFWIGVVPLIGLCFLPLVIETKGRQLAD